MLPARPAVPPGDTEAQKRADVGAAEAKKRAGGAAEAKKRAGGDTETKKRAVSRRTDSFL